VGTEFVVSPVLNKLSKELTLGAQCAGKQSVALCVFLILRRNQFLLPCGVLFWGFIPKNIVGGS
jgi:hypothetical protein